MKQPWRPFKDQDLKLEFEKGEAKAWELYQTFCELVGGICWDFLCVFALYCWEKILLDFFGFCAGTFSMLQTLLPKVSGVIPFHYKKTGFSVTSRFGHADVGAYVRSCQR